LKAILYIFLVSCLATFTSFKTPPPSSFDFTKHVIESDSITFKVYAKENKNEIYFIKDIFFNERMISKWNDCSIKYLSKDQIDSTIKKNPSHKILLVYTYESEFETDGVSLFVIFGLVSGDKKHRLIDVITSGRLSISYDKLGY
jgi:hypothetical protein